jgi:hypothetical protein
MALETRDFRIEQGTHFILQFDLTEDGGNSLGTVVNNAIGSYSFAMNCRRSKHSGSTLSLVNISGVTMLGTGAGADDGTTADGFYVFQSLPGRVMFVMSDATTSLLKHGMLLDYEIEVRDYKGSTYEATKIMVGKITPIADGE